MPKVTPIAFDPKLISLSVERYAKRSVGVHLGHIIKDRLITAGIDKEIKSGKSILPDQQHCLFQQGFLWENIVAQYTALKECREHEWDEFVRLGLQQALQDDIDHSEGALVRPGEQQMDGVYITPDAINNKLWFYEEYKATAIRDKNFNIETRKPHWLWQGAANCRVFGMTRALFRVWHYGQMPPNITTLIVDWTKDEIDEEWRRLLEHLEYMKKVGRI